MLPRFASLAFSMNTALHRLANAPASRWRDGVRFCGAFLIAASLAIAGDLRPKGEFKLTDADHNHWAFQPIQWPVAGGQKSEVKNSIDKFILTKLESNGLTLSPRASNEALIRRITLDLIGLPPTPQEIDAFIQSAIHNPKSAIESLIDRLLASPNYGERWGRHWLDLARYAETDGFEHDAVRPHSWRYRDYVIQSFNADKPYDRFIREQIAGDELWPDDPAAITATGFNLLGPDMVDSSDQIQRRHNTLNDMTDTAALAFLGLTMGCARCHDHKFEPISQRDYYSMQAFFTPAKFVRDKPIPTSEANVAFEAAMKVFNENPKVRELAELEAPVREKIFQRKVAKLSPEAQAAHRTPEDKRDAEQANLVLETADKVVISDKDVSSALSGVEKDRHKTLLNEVKKLPRPASLPKAMALADTDKPVTKTFVLRRGEYSQQLDEVTTEFPEVLRGGFKSEAKETGRRALANWIASPQNPLTARVMVNRIWQHHFGRGLVATPSEFGTHGQPPTHPELLDWLASKFIASGWSVKQMHKLMMMSETYLQASNSEFGMRNAESNSTIPNSNFRIPTSVDPDNKLLSHMNRLRLEGEVIRDSLLAISGKLNPLMGGPGVFPPIPKEVFAGAKGGWPQNDRAFDHSRRSIYIFARRNLRFPFLEVFDAPDSNLSCPSRERSTTAPQSLTLLNADEVLAASATTAARLERDAKTTDGKIKLAYRLVLGRAPNAKEFSIASEFLVKSPLEELCRALFNLNDFVYAE